MIKTIVLLVLATVMFADPEWIHAYSEPFDWSNCTRTTLGTYRGVSCDCADLSPDAGSGLIYGVELYFRLNQTEPIPWDTSYFYLEFWNEDLTECIAQIDKEANVAVNHCYPTVIDLSSNPIQVEQNFWVIINTERSEYGFPRSVTDNTPGTCVMPFPVICWLNWYVAQTTSPPVLNVLKLMASGLIQRRWLAGKKFSVGS